MFERMRGPARFSMIMAASIGHALVRPDLRHQHGLDNMVVVDRDRVIAKLDTACQEFTPASSPRQWTAGSATVAELEALIEYIEQHAPTTYDDLTNTNPYAPPDPVCTQSLVQSVRHAEYRHQVHL